MEVQNPNVLNSAESACVQELRERGFAVVIFNPTELGNANPSRVEDRLVELGWEVIGILGS